MGNDEVTASEEELNDLTRLTIADIQLRLARVPSTREDLRASLLGEVVGMIPHLTKKEQKDAPAQLLEIFGSDFQSPEWKKVFEYFAASLHDASREYGYGEPEGIRKKIDRFLELLPKEGKEAYKEYSNDRYWAFTEKAVKLAQRFNELMEQMKTDISVREEATDVGSSLLHVIAAHPIIGQAYSEEISHATDLDPMLISMMQRIMPWW